MSEIQYKYKMSASSNVKLNRCVKKKKKKNSRLSILIKKGNYVINITGVFLICFNYFSGSSVILLPKKKKTQRFWKRQCFAHAFYSTIRTIQCRLSDSRLQKLKNQKTASVFFFFLSCFVSIRERNKN